MGNSGKTDDLTIVGPVGIIDAMNAIKVLVEYLPYRVYVIENPKEKFSLEHDILKERLNLIDKKRCPMKYHKFYGKSSKNKIL